MSRDECLYLEGVCMCGRGQEGGGGSELLECYS